MLQSSNFAAAFALLKAQPELRTSDLPTPEKKSLIVLAKALKVPENAQLWAEALFDEAASLRLFAAKTLLRLRDAAKPVAEPLQNVILNIWKHIVPMPQNQWQAFHDQQEMLARAAEVLFCADTKGTLLFLDQQLKMHMPVIRAYAGQSHAFYARSQAAQNALHAAIAEIVLAEHKISDRWGINTLPDEIRTEIYQRAKAHPEVAALQESIGQDPVAKANHLFPISAFSRAIHRLAKSKTQPQKTVLEQLREPLWAYVEAGLKPGGDDEAAFALQFLSYGIKHDEASLFPDNFYLERAPQLMAAVRTDQAADTALQAMDDYTASPAYEPRLQLWSKMAHALLTVFEHDKQVRPEAWPAEKSLEFLQVLHLGDDEQVYLHRRVRSAIARYVNSYQPQPATTPSVTRQVKKMSVQEKKELVQAHLKNTQVDSFELKRGEGESADAFLQRASREFTAFAQNLQLAFNYEYTPQWNSLHQEASTKFHAAVLSLSDEEKRAAFLAASRNEKDWFFNEPAGQALLTRLNETYPYPDDNHFLRAIADQLWANCEAAIRDFAQAPQLSSWHEDKARKSAWFRLANSKNLLTAMDGEATQFRILQIALRLRARSVVRQLEQEILNTYLDRLPSDVGSRESWLSWQFEESDDELLEHLAQSVAKWPADSRGWAYSSLATGFYRRFTTETRQRCWEMAALSIGITDVLFHALIVYQDEETWLVTLVNAPKIDDRFFEFWKWRRGRDEQEAFITRIIWALSNATTESAVAMILKMLGELSLEELGLHSSEIAQVIESPQEKAAKWAFEMLLQIAPHNLDWPRVIETTSEKLWSQNAGLAKLGAKFLGTTPIEHSTVAWEKLCEAMTLENRPLIEAILRALVALKLKNKSLKLDTASGERIEMLAELAPERFEKFSRKLGG